MTDEQLDKNHGESHISHLIKIPDRTINIISLAMLSAHFVCGEDKRTHLSKSGHYKLS